MPLAAHYYLITICGPGPSPLLYPSLPHSLSTSASSTGHQQDWTWDEILGFPATFKDENGCVKGNDEQSAYLLLSPFLSTHFAGAPKYLSSKGLSPLNHGELLLSHLSLVSVTAQVGPPERTFFSFQHCSRIQPKNGLKSLSFQE
ncbi:Insulin-Like Growth Factor-Binding Protein Complex Acid Labile Subunit [Manis pentadactyla]|nr:Insulin-Like Growth Factor-Binding Protein Complex Acid Labile Subunit [Manis pentadactyla]